MRKTDKLKNLIQANILCEQRYLKEKADMDETNMMDEDKKEADMDETNMLDEEEAKNNPWAICTASVGRDDKEKYESCVRDVKKEKGIK